jgi:S-formylglutathione hydrolase FrmB
MNPRFLALAVLVSSFMTLSAASQDPPRPLEFQLTFDKSVSSEPFTGRVYVMLSKQDIKELRAGPNWFKPEPFFAVDVTSWKPGETRVLDGKALACPQPLAKLAKGSYSIQAVMDFDRGTRHFSTADGNGYSKAVRRDLDAANPGPIQLVIDQVYRTKPFQERERVKLVEIESKRLTDFHKKPTKLRAGVVLPKSFAQNPGRRYPAIYEIPGFGGRHTGAHFAAARNATDVAGVEMLYVVLDPDCRLGHHVFADSDNNGPCGRALCEELIPAIETRFRALARPGARFVTGHSSGGWSSLWLQVAYPDFFGGVWSTAPDPVDFRDFQLVDIYQRQTNIFHDAAGDARPLARRAKKATLFYKPFSDMEVVMGRGGQLFSFEAVFGPKGSDGNPRPLWDRVTGRIDADVAKSWERYDIRLVLERNWQTLGPKLKGKVHIYVGAEDTFYLEGATILLKQSLRELGSDAVIEILPGRDHSTLMDGKLRQRIAQEMAAQFKRHIN